MRLLLTLLLTLSTLLSLASAGSPPLPLAIFYGHETLPVSERGYIQSRARNIQQWYKQNGLTPALLPDSKLPAELPGLNVAILVAPNPDAAQLRALTAFRNAGGHLITFYAYHPALAQLCGVRLEPFRRTPSTPAAEQWAAMRFTPGLLKGAPAAIAQPAPTLHPAFPAPGGNAKTLATWQRRDGATTGVPALLMSPAGFWFPTLLQPGSDAGQKSRLLMHMAGALHPPLLSTAARNLLKSSDTVAGMSRKKLLATARKNKTAAPHADELASLQSRVQQLLTARNHLESWEAALLLQEKTTALYARLQPSRAGEIRGIWDHAGTGLYPGDWPRTCRELADAGITDLYINIAGPGFAHYPSAHLPRSATFAAFGDQLDAALSAARPHNLRIHAWVLFASTTGATPERLATLKPLLLTTASGAPCNYLNPTAPGARKYLLDTLTELAVRYPRLHGVHLDYMRYPDFPSSLGKETRDAFLAQTKNAAPKWPLEVGDGKTDGPLRARFLSWRSEVITRRLRDARERLREKSPRMVLTVAVYGKHPACRDSVGQDWEAWIRDGLVDYVLPMNYTEKLDTFTEWLNHQTRTSAQARHILPGLGVTAAESRLDAPAVITQILYLRKRNCPGFVLFDLNATLAEKILPMLRLGITAGNTPAQ